MIASVSFLLASATAFTNVNGGDLERCSGRGMALTGFTRNGHCVDQNDDAGSHHVCIDMSSTTGGNFCSVTGQPNWCGSSMACDGSAGVCPVEHWVRQPSIELFCTTGFSLLCSLTVPCVRTSVRAVRLPVGVRLVSRACWRL